MQRRYILGIMSLIVGVLLFGYTTDKMSSQSSANQTEQAEINQQTKAYAEAFSKHDPEAMAAFWSADADYMNPVTGESVHGRAALVEEFTHWFKDKQVDKIEITLKDTTFPEPGVAIEDGVARVMFQGDKAAKDYGFRAQLVKEDNKWLYSKMRQIHFTEAPTHYSELKALDWLVGDWVDSDEDVDIQITTKWDKYKNFLIRKFTMDLYKQDFLEVQQIIRWNPIEKKIQSWIFDSDGGVGEGTWFEKDNTWVEKVSFVLANGTRASSINIYKKIDENSYMWSSVARDVNGEILPNINPVKIERKSGQVEK